MDCIYIPKGTIVQGQKGLVKLVGPVFTEATRQEDGSYLYKVSGKPYYVSAGCCSDLAEHYGPQHP